jgi:ureidoglycolate lyase
MTRLPIEELTAETFAPFGRVVERPDRTPDATGPGWRWWAEKVLLGCDERPFGVGYLDLEPAEPRFDWAERHLRTVEVILPLGGDCLAYVGPPEHPEEPERIASRDRFRVFRVRAGQGIAMDPGVWHGAPLAADGPLTAVVLILEKTGSIDTALVRFPEEPVEIGE